MIENLEICDCKLTVTTTVVTTRHDSTFQTCGIVNKLQKVPKNDRSEKYSKILYNLIIIARIEDFNTAKMIKSTFSRSVSSSSASYNPTAQQSTKTSPTGTSTKQTSFFDWGL